MTRKKKRINPEHIEIGVRNESPADEVEVNRTGVVTFFNESKGFGFIKDATRRKYFSLM